MSTKDTDDVALLAEGKADSSGVEHVFKGQIALSSPDGKGRGDPEHNASSRERGGLLINCLLAPTSTVNRKSRADPFRTSSHCSTMNTERDETNRNVDEMLKVWWFQ